MRCVIVWYTKDCTWYEPVFFECDDHGTTIVFPNEKAAELYAKDKTDGEDQYKVVCFK